MRHQNITKKTLGVLALLGATSLGGIQEAKAEKFAAPSGPLGAGLSTDSSQLLRAYAEMSFYAATPTVGGLIPAKYSAFPIVLGGGIKVSDDIELEGQLPIAIGSSTVLGQKFGGAGLGNLQVGGNFVHEWGPARLKAGLALAWGPWNRGGDDSSTAMALSSTVRLDEGNLWEVQVLNLSIPTRFEIDLNETLALSVDAKLIGQIPTGDTVPGNAFVPGQTGDPEITLNLAPGLAYVGEYIVAGLRTPLWWLMTEGGDNAQLALEPFVRADIDTFFVNSRFTLNLDEPLGFAFDEGKVWALHLGGGFYL